MIKNFFDLIKKYSGLTAPGGEIGGHNTNLRGSTKNIDEDFEAFDHFWKLSQEEHVDNKKICGDLILALDQYLTKNRHQKLTNSDFLKTRCAEMLVDQKTHYLYKCDSVEEFLDQLLVNYGQFTFLAPETNFNPFISGVVCLFFLIIFWRSL
jgi:hypothetical protein